VRGPTEWGRSAPGTPDPARTTPRRRCAPRRRVVPPTPVSPEDGPREFEMSVGRSGDLLRLALRGDLDLLARDRFLATLSGVVGEGEHAELDLTGLTLIDSTGLRSLLDAERLVEERGGGRLSLVVAPDGPIRRMIQLTLLHLSLDVRTADGGR
jgi:anti-sigma B factor antagonist